MPSKRSIPPLADREEVITAPAPPSVEATFRVPHSLRAWHVEDMALKMHRGEISSVSLLSVQPRNDHDEMTFGFMLCDPFRIMSNRDKHRSLAKIIRTLWIQLGVHEARDAVEA
jgi:hypothetical protein